MATYPGAVKSFTTKNAGDTIQPSHVNDLQDEVNAIEDGLLNGTAPLNSSRITAPAIQIANGSTFLQRPIMPPPEMALVYVDSTVALASSVNSTVLWKSESYVSNAAMHSTTTNPERLIPQTTGVYQFSAQVTIAGVPSTNILVRLAILDSSNGNIALAQHYLSSIGSPHAFQVVGYKRFDAIGGYGVLTFVNAGPGASTLSLSSGIGVTWFSMVKL